MKNKAIQNAMDTVNPTREQRERMRKRLLDGLPEEKPEHPKYQARQRAPKRGSWIGPMAALLAVLAAGGMFLGRAAGREAPGPVPAVSSTAPEEKGMPEAYEELLKKYTKAITQDWDGERLGREDMSILVRDVVSLKDLGYSLRDLDGDGTQELLITDGNVIYDLYTLEGEEAAHVLTGWERNAYFLTEEGILANVGANSASQTDYYFYRLAGNGLSVVEHIRFDAGWNPKKPWFREVLKGEGIQTTELSFEAITAEEADAIIDGYPHSQIASITLSDYEKDLRKDQVKNDLEQYREEAERLQEELERAQERYRKQTE